MIDVLTIPPLVIFSIFVLLLASYQNQAVAQTPPSADLRFCLDTPTTPSTLRSFWHAASSNCELDPERLIDLYMSLNDQLIDAGEDHCTVLLIHQIRKKLIVTASQQLEEAFVTSLLGNNRELNRLLEGIHAIDQRISEAIWQRALDEVHLFVEPTKLVENILQLKSDHLQLFGIKVLLIKCRAAMQENTNIWPLFTYAFTKLLNSKRLSAKAKDQAKFYYHQMPQELRLLYSQYEQIKSIGFLNQGQWEYLYAPRDNGPDADRRIPLTWSKEKNYTDSDGYFKLEFSSPGLVAFASPFGSSLKLLYVDIENRAPYFWIGTGTKRSRQWWQIVWPYDSLQAEGDERPVALQSNATAEFLCSSSPYDENRRYVVLKGEPDSVHSADCLWFVKQF